MTEPWLFATVYCNLKAQIGAFLDPLQFAIAVVETIRFKE